MSLPATIRRAATTPRSLQGLPCIPRTRRISATSRQRNQQGADDNTHVDVDALLSKPTWSVSSLLPAKHSGQPQAISSKQLHHLLRLSALPPPTSAAEEEKLLSTLSAQLHFVKEIQKVDTSDVEPLRSLMDETEAGENEAEIGLDAMKEALALEEIRGKHHKRIRRRNGEGGKKEEAWDALGTAERRVGRFFVVEGGKEG